MAKILVTDTDGKQHELEATEGWKVMEIIREGGLPIRADCGGCCACATCHVYVDPAWMEKVGGVNEDEDALLDDSFIREDTSRLSCQIEFTPELDGLHVTLTSDAVE